MFFDISFFKDKNIFSFFKKNTDIIHFVGIGGNGMSGIAEMLFLSGYEITGSDLSNNDRVKYLLKLGIKIFLFHSEKNVFNATIVVYSEAISLCNPEIVYSLNNNVILLKRLEMLKELIKFKYSIIVTGSHGKTTTVSILHDMLKCCDIKTCCINGGNIKSVNSYITLNKSNYFILELDESDRFFINLNPNIVILTSIDKDHLSNYNNSFSLFIKYFIKFLFKIPFYGYLIVYIDDKNIEKIILLNKFKCRIITYGFSNKADYQIINYFFSNYKNFFSILIFKRYFFTFTTSMLGKHNLLNIISVLCLLFNSKNINFLSIKNSLCNLKGVNRRMEIIGKFNFEINNILYKDINVVYDYGHHPTSINYVLQTLKIIYNKKRVIMLFQPHRFSRTKDNFNDFINVLTKVDILFLFDIFSAGESYIKNITSNNLLCGLYNINFFNSILVTKNNFLYFIMNIIKSNDLILFQGAGDLISICLKIFISKLNYFKNLKL